MSEMVDKVARAIQREQLVHGPDYERLARAAIEALREPSEAMIAALADARTVLDAWPDMIDAALNE